MDLSVLENAMTHEDRIALGRTIAGLIRQGEVPAYLPNAPKNERLKAYSRISEALFMQQSQTPVLREMASVLAGRGPGIGGVPRAKLLEVVGSVLPQFRQGWDQGREALATAMDTHGFPALVRQHLTDTFYAFHRNGLRPTAGDVLRSVERAFANKPVPNQKRPRLESLPHDLQVGTPPWFVKAVSVNPELNVALATFLESRRMDDLNLVSKALSLETPKRRKAVVSALMYLRPPGG
jgi:hypothetical protein